MSPRAPRNPARRDQLLDAGLAVLAEQGARGLTFRAVDARAGVATGTATNYFTDRDALLAELGERIHARLEPGEEELGAALAGAPTPAVMRRLLARVLERREVYVALLELRLEATRRPALRRSLTATVRARFEQDVAFHEQAGAPGGRRAVALLHHAMEGLILDQLTLPEALGDPAEAGELAGQLAEMITRGV
ncbi:TetR/AcrR family transcriptional regulator [Actinomycetospora sp. C-140]